MRRTPIRTCKQRPRASALVSRMSEIRATLTPCYKRISQYQNSGMTSAAVKLSKQGTRKFLTLPTVSFVQEASLLALQSLKAPLPCIFKDLKSIFCVKALSCQPAIIVQASGFGQAARLAAQPSCWNTNKTVLDDQMAWSPARTNCPNCPNKLGCLAICFNFLGTMPPNVAAWPSCLTNLPHWAAWPSCLNQSVSLSCLTKLPSQQLE